MKTSLNLNNQKIIKSVLLIFLTLNSFSQDIYLKGKIVDQYLKPIPFVNIIVTDKKIGTFSSENGEFELMQNDLLDTDFIEFFCLGYEARTISVSDLKINDDMVILTENRENLKEVTVIIPKNLKTFTKGKSRTNTQLIRFSSSFNANIWNEPGHEIGRKFNLGTKKTSYLDSLSFYIKKNTFQNVKLGINIYNIKKNIPFQNILPSTIIVTGKNQFTGWKTIDLTDLNIQVKEDIIVTVEFIKAAPSCDYKTESCGLFLSYIHPTILTPPMYIKDGLKSHWDIRKKETIAMTLTYKQ